MATTKTYRTQKRETLNGTMWTVQCPNGGIVAWLNSKQDAAEIASKYTASESKLAGQWQRCCGEVH